MRSNLNVVQFLHSSSSCTEFTISGLSRRSGQSPVVWPGDGRPGRTGVGGGVAGGAAGVPRPVAPTGPLSPSPPPNPRLALPSHTCGPSRPAGRRGTMTVGVTSQWSLEAAAAPASGGRQARSHPSRPVVPIRIPWKSYYILRIRLKTIIG